MAYRHQKHIRSEMHLKELLKPVFAQARTVVSVCLLIIGFGVALMVLLKPYRDLVLFALYSIPSHMLISPFPHEPVLLYFAKFHSPFAIAIAGTVGCCIAGWLDYRMLTPVLHHHKIRSRYRDARLYQKAVDWFRKWPFGALVIAGYSPLPFYPFKFLSITIRYPLRKYQMALIVGRAPRYFTLAWLGYVLQPPNWVLVALVIALFLVSQWKKGLLLFKRSKMKARQQPVCPGEVSS